MHLRVGEVWDGGRAARFGMMDSSLRPAETSSRRRMVVDGRGGRGGRDDGRRSVGCPRLVETQIDCARRKVLRRHPARPWRPLGLLRRASLAADPRHARDGSVYARGAHPALEHHAPHALLAARRARSATPPPPTWSERAGLSASSLGSGSRRACRLVRIRRERRTGWVVGFVFHRLQAVGVLAVVGLLAVGTTA